MQNEYESVQGLLGRPVRIVAVSEESLPALVLTEVSGMGVVAEDSSTLRFFPWHEIVEIGPAEGAACDDEDGELVDALLGVDSEP